MRQVLRETGLRATTTARHLSRFPISSSTLQPSSHNFTTSSSAHHYHHHHYHHRLPLLSRENTYCSLLPEFAPSAELSSLSSRPFLPLSYPHRARNPRTSAVTIRVATSSRYFSSASTMATETLPVRGKSAVLASQLEKPDLDNRSYRVIQLPNKLEALLVHDPDTDKASAALDVHVGNFSDSEDLQGQAHAVEHLLFMGTEKYPKENEYSQYLSEHSGSSNAYTASTSTNYYFEVGHEHFYGALDRFAQFFIAPLFLEDTLDRELRAVDSENKKNLQSDTWRLHQLSKSLSNPNHPYCHFSTGNLQTLKELPEKRGVNVREEFMKFHDRYYSANNMKLVVLGREDLDTLQTWVEELFEGVKNKDLPKPYWEGQPLGDEHLMTQVFAKPVMDTRQLEITFPFLDEEHLFRSHPSTYASHLIGHEGPGSLLAYLKKKAWANGLSAGSIHVCSGSAFFQISIKCTEEGLEHYEEIVKATFHYINLIKDTEVQSWIVNELQNTAAVDFKFRQKTPPSKFTSRQAVNLQKPIPREWLLSQSLIREFNPELITKALEHLRPDNFRVMVVSQKCPRGDYDQLEKWYKTEYRVEKLSESFMQELQSTVGQGKGAGALKDELHLPHKNEFIPTNFDVQKKKVDVAQIIPVLVKNNALTRLWYKKDDTFWVPKANVFITLRNHLAYSAPANAAAARIYCDLVKDALNEYAYDAEIAGLDYAVGASSVGLEIEVEGYNDKMSVLLEKVITTMRDLQIQPDRFKVVKDRNIRSYRNWIYQAPYHQVGEYSRYMNAQTMWLNEEYLVELENLTIEDVQNFFPKLLRQTHIEMLVHGNLHKEGALKFANLIESILSPKPLPPSQWNIRRSLITPEGGRYVWTRPLMDPKNVNSVIEYTLFVGEQTDKRLKNLLTLFSQLTEEPCFDQLRTKEQLGYIVFSGSRYAVTTMGYRIIVQSERSAAYLESRIESFLRSFKQKLADITHQEFQSHVKAAILKKTEKLKNLNQETNRLWNYICSEMYDFEQLPKDVEILQQLTKQDVVDFYNRYIDPDSPQRSKVSVQMQAAAASAEDRKPGLAEALVQFLSAAAGVVTEHAEVTKALEGVDINNTDAVVEAVSSFLKNVKRIEEPMIAAILEKGRAALAQAIPVKEEGEEQFKPEQFGEVFETIHDVVAWKASCRATAGPKAVKPLVEFESSDAKL